MPTNNVNPEQARRHGFRTHIRVVREARGTIPEREWPNMFVAYRELLGTNLELGYSEHQRMRAAIRAGLRPRDSYGFTWRSSAPITTTGGMQISWSDFTFGVEIECLAPFAMGAMSDLLSANDLRTWKVVYDGSLQRVPGYEPMEVVSPVLQGEAGLEQLRKCMDLLKSKGVKVNQSCGMHVHVGVRGLPIQRVRKIAQAFLGAEQWFDGLVPPARLNNRYCQSNARRVSSYSRNDLENATSIRLIAKVMNGGTASRRYNPYRYFKLNFQSFVHHGTIEFRQHGGTVESEKAAAWVRLITGFCATAAGAESVASFQSLDQFLADCAGDAVTYLRGRAAHFAAQRQRAAA